jgi:phosphatidylethanolamine/phosphatidyl-N-methylethanolamine N-methyltransferase
MYVASVVRDPVRLVNEMRRVCRDGGELYIINHFRNPNRLIGGIEKRLAPLAGLIGFHPDFCLETFLRDCGLESAERFPVNLFGYWTLIRARVEKPQKASSADTISPSKTNRERMAAVAGSLRVAD